MSFKITFNNQTKEFDKKVQLTELSNSKDFICAMVNGRVRELDYFVYYDAEVEFLTTKNLEGMGTYERGIRFLFSMACHNLFPKAKFRLTYGVSRAVFAQNINTDFKLSFDNVRQIETEMKRLAAADIDFVRTIISKEEAATLFKENNLLDKLETLEYRPEKTVHIYTCDGYFNYLYGKMVPSTGYLKSFRLIYYPPGIMIQYPRAEFNGEIPPFFDEPTFSNTLIRSQKWSKMVGLDTVVGINKAAIAQEGARLINLCENKHNRMLCELGQQIQDHINDIRVICVAGPSSSGKTTFADRLTLELISRGIQPIRVSIDDYYKRREDIPLEPDGSRDFESLDALDVDLFNHHLLDLLEGKEVALPRFSFKENARHFGEPISIRDNQPIIIEGIHALNENMTPLIPLHFKYKIYISPQVQINLDNENPISLTDIRLIRRMVRDFKYRGSEAEDTLKMWPSVRKGEFKWIYKTQEDANYVFDSFLNYELMIMKKYALPLLYKIDKESEYGSDAQRLIKLLKYFADMDEKWIPSNSLIKEFIGGSCYRDTE
ncbi:MAG TPA: hypothetical protein VJY64_02105 [Candidatus Onthovivens sp.]|nr:hypothetical protein [Candidatus Onthovivens sp.]